MKLIRFARKDISSLLPIFIALYLLFSMVSISISQIFIALALVCWLILLITKKQKFLVPRFFWILVIFSIFSLLASFFSVNPGMSLKNSRELLLFLVIPIVFTGIQNIEPLKRANFALLVSASLGSLYGIYQSIFKLRYWERSSGFMGQPMTQAGLLILFISLALCLLILSRHKLKWLWGLIIPIAVLALVLTQIRSSWIGLLAASFVILALYKPKALISIPLAIGIIFIFGSQFLKERTTSIFNLRSDVHIERFEFIRAGIKIIKDYPLLGTGPDTVDIVFQDPKYGLSEEAKKNVHLHNNIIQIAAERGIITAMVWLAFIVWTFLSLIKLLKNKDPTLRPFAAAALTALIAFFTAGQFEYNFGDSEITTLFLYIMTVPFALERMIHLPNS